MAVLESPRPGAAEAEEAVPLKMVPGQPEEMPAEQPEAAAEMPGRVAVLAEHHRRVLAPIMSKGVVGVPD